MPEFGIIVKLNPELDRFTWYGRGPVENYPDRNNGCPLGIYSKKVAEAMTPYVRPQECGSHTGIRYIKVVDGDGAGLGFEALSSTGSEGECVDGVCAHPQMTGSVLPYTPHEIENAGHLYELSAMHYSVVKIAGEQMGVAGDDSWGARPHPEYIIDSGRAHSFKFTMRGIG